MGAMGSEVDNQIYDRLGRRWYFANDDPIALLRAEARHRNPWIAGKLREADLKHVLDVGCGGGLLSNYLARAGFRVVGLDQSTASLSIAREFDSTRSVQYQVGDALALPYPDASFDAVCAMDLLEHVEQPARLISEASRVLRAEGLFLFHTFNRNWLAWLVVIKGVEWFVENTPPRLHQLRFFLRPDEVRRMCAAAGLRLRELHGVGPAMLSSAFFRMLATGTVAEDFCFEFKRSRLLGYTACAVRK